MKMLVAMFLTLLLVPGCGSVLPFTSIKPPSSHAINTVAKTFGGQTVTKTVTETEPKTGKAITTTVKTELPPTFENTLCESQSQGAELNTLNPDAAKSFSTGAVGDIIAGKASTEGVTASTIKSAISSSGGAWVFIIGALAVLAGIVGAVYFKLTPVGWYVAGAGVVLIGMGFMVPMYGGWILLTALVLGAVALVYYIYTHKAITTDLVASVQKGANALAAYSKDAVAVFKSATSQEMDKATKEAVKEVKAGEGIEDVTPPTTPSAPATP